MDRDTASIREVREVREAKHTSEPIANGTSLTQHSLSNGMINGHINISNGSVYHDVPGNNNHNKYATAAVHASFGNVSLANPRNFVRGDNHSQRKPAAVVDFSFNIPF